MSKSSKPNKDPKGSLEMKAVFNDVAASKVDLEKLVWASGQVGREAIATLLKRMDASLKFLIPLLSQANDDATVRASFALEGMTMEATAFGNQETARQLSIALSNNLKYAKDDTARCIVLSCLEKLNAVEPVCDSKIIVQCVAKCLSLGEPVFSHALAVLRCYVGSRDESKALERALTATDDLRRKGIISGALLEIDSSFKEICNNPIQYVSQFKSMPDICSMLCIKLANEGNYEMLNPLLDGLERLESALVSPAVARGCLENLCLYAMPNATDYLSDVFGLSDDEEHDDDCCDDDCCDDDCCDDDCCDDDDPFDTGKYEREVANAFAVAEPKEPALIGLVTAMGETIGMYATLWECVSEGDLLLRRTALKFLEKGFRQKGMTENMVLLAQGIEDDEIKSDILGMLGRRGEMAARPYILSCILDGSPTVRAAALEAAARLEGRPLDSGLLTALLLALK